MTRSGSNTRKRAATLTARVEPELKDMVRKAAGSQTESDWLRALVIDRLGDDVAKLGAPKKPRRKKLSAPENAEFGELARAVAQATGMLKFSAETFRKAGEQRLHADAEAALSTMTAAATRVLAMLDEQSA